MRRKFSWPFVIVILSSFVFGTIWGVKLIRDRAAIEGRLEAEGKLRILAPPGILSKEILLEFQRREKIEVELTTETFPASLLRRALKSAPGQYDAAIVFHHQVSALRAERKLASLFDSRVKFPTSIAPDFRKLPNDRNLMDTAPLMWGLLGIATGKDSEGPKTQAAFWPSPLIGLEEISVTPAMFATKTEAMLGKFPELEASMKKGLELLPDPVKGPLVVSHASLAFSPLKELGLKFGPLVSDGDSYYPMWILTVAALSEGDLERTRKFIKFLFEPAQNIAMLETSRVGASTLRDHDGTAVLPDNLKASYFRKFPIDAVLLERDERVRSADEVLEQVVLGANLKPVKTNEPTRPKAAPPAAPKAAKRPAEPVDDGSGDDESEPTDAPALGTTAPSGATPHGD